MSRLTEITEALDTIRVALAENGATPPVSHNADLSLDRNEIAMMVAVFQPRDRDLMYSADRRHIATLADAIGNPERPTYLDRVTVWWGGDRWYVIDGHHRLEAYGVKGVRKAIPCRAFSGSLDEAMAYSGLANSKDRLPMSKIDKLNFAWRLTLTTELSKAYVAKASSVSSSTVANMRKAKEALLVDPEVTIGDLVRDGWKKSDMKARGVEFDGADYDPEEAVVKRADLYRERLYKALGNKPHTDPEAFALALVRSDERLPGILMQTMAWGEPFRETLLSLKRERDMDDELAAAAGELLSADESDY